MIPLSCGGHLSWKQYIPKKGSHFILKAIVLSEGSTVYVWNIILYTGGDYAHWKHWFWYHATKVILTLMGDLLHKRHCVYINNWYTSIEICNVLNNNTTDVIVTLQWDRRGLPDAFMKKKLKQGKAFVQYEHKMGLAVRYWNIKRDVFTITTCIPDSKTVVKRQCWDDPINCHSYI